jgi:hypothetical protein
VVTAQQGAALQLLKGAPRIARVAIIFQPETGSGTTLTSIEAAAASLAVTAIRTIVRDGADIAQQAAMPVVGPIPHRTIWPRSARALAKPAKLASTATM